MSDKVYLGSKVAELETGGDAQRISLVNLAVDTDHIYTAGDDTGQTLEVECPWGSQAMADSILYRISLVNYLPYSAADALLDPAAELGDGITVGGVYSVLAQASTSLDRVCAVGISAPGGDEIDDEYPYQSIEQRKTQRQLAQTRSLIAKTSEEILLQVENEMSGLSSSLSVQLERITSTVTGLDGRVSTVEQTASSLTSRISGLDGQVSGIEQYVDSITLSVSNGSTSSAIKLMAGGVEIASQTISMSGLVTFTGLSSGVTTIDGACIKTGTISANRLNLTGAITWGDLSGGVQSDITDAQSTADSAYSLAVNNKLPSYIKSTYIDATTVQSPTIEGGEIYGAELYATDGRDTYAKIEDGSFALMRVGSSIPRAILEATNTDVSLVLGTGTGTSYASGRFYIQKSYSSGLGNIAGIYYVKSNGVPFGMVFYDDGTIAFDANEVTGLYLRFS